MDPVTAAEVIWCSLHGLTSVLLDHSDTLETDLDSLAEMVLDVTLKGLCQR
jgi:hypothetical protein